MFINVFQHILFQPAKCYGMKPPGELLCNALQKKYKKEEK